MKRILTLIFLLISFVYLSDAQSNALFPISYKGKTGYIDDAGKVVIKPQFDEGWKFSEGFAPVLVADAWGYIDEKGAIVIKPQFFQAGSFSDGIASVGVYFAGRKTINDQVGYYSYIDRKGKLITDMRFGVAFSFAEGLAQILTNDYKHGFIDKTGKIIFYFDTYGTGFSDGLAMFKTNGNMPDTKVGYIDKTGKIVIEAKYNGGEEFSEGFACVLTDKGAGFIDKRENVVIDYKYTYCQSFSEGLAAVYIDGKWGFVDKTGKMVITPQFAEVQPFSDGVAVVQMAKGIKYAGEKDRFKNGNNIVVAKSGLYGVIDKAGKFILPHKFTQIGNFSNGLAWVNLDGSYIVHGEARNWGYINKKGKYVWKSSS